MARSTALGQKLPKGVSAVSPLTSQQLNIAQQLAPLGLQGIQQNRDISPILNQVKKDFTQRIQPSIAERFAGFDIDAGQSSPYQQAMQEAQTNLSERLAALQSQHQLSLLPFYQSLLGMGLNPQYEFFQKPRNPGFFESLGGGISQGIGTALPLLALGGLPAGAAGFGAGLLGNFLNNNQSQTSSPAMQLQQPRTLANTTNRWGQSPMPTLFPNLSALNLWGV